MAWDSGAGEGLPRSGARPDQQSRSPRLLQAGCGVVGSSLDPVPRGGKSA